MWRIWVICISFPLLMGIMYFGTTMYTSDQLDDMEERGEITWIQHSLRYEKMQMGEYKLYPKFIRRLRPTKEKKQ